MNALQKAVRDPSKAVRVAREKALTRFVDLQNRLQGPPGPPAAPSRDEAFAEVQRRSTERTDINEHLPTLFVEGLLASPKLIVELGVRTGESTFAFERVAALTGATLIGVDIEDCSRASLYPHWHFVKEDDVAFARRFPAFCDGLGVEPEIDVLFVDTSHEYRHTCEEIAAWFPLLSERATAIFHDTHMREVFRRTDGSLGYGWDNRRGVIRAIEEYLRQRFDESVDFVHYEPGWLVRHYAHCNGLTIVKRLPLG